MKNRSVCYCMLLIIIGMYSCTNNETANVSIIKSADVIVIDGSSTVYPILKNAIDVYKQESVFQNTAIHVDYSGTSRGFEKLISGEADIIGASRPINMKEDRACRATDLEYIEMKICYDGIVIVTNTKNSWANSITKTELKKLWNPEAHKVINTWKEVNNAWPSLPIHLYGAGKNSGTYDYFTEVIVGSTRQSRGDFTSSEDDNYLVYRVSSDSLALGFFGYHYFAKNRHILKALKVDNEDKNGAVEPNDNTIKTGIYKPLSRPLFIYVSKESMAKASTRKFLTYFVNRLDSFVQTGEYIQSSPEETAMLKEKLDQLITGSDYIKSVQ